MDWHDNLCMTSNPSLEHYVKISVFTVDPVVHGLCLENILYVFTMETVAEKKLAYMDGMEEERVYN